MSAPTVAPTPARTRISPLRVAVLLLCTRPGRLVRDASRSRPRSRRSTPGPSYFAGYVDVTNTPAYPFETPSGPAQSNVTLAFVVSGPDDAARRRGAAPTPWTRRPRTSTWTAGSPSCASWAVRPGCPSVAQAGTELASTLHRPGGAGRRVPGGRRPLRAHEHRPRPRGHLPGRRGGRCASSRRDQGRPGPREQRRTLPSRLADPPGRPGRAHDRGRAVLAGDAVRRRGPGRRQRDDHGLRQRRIARPGRCPPRSSRHPPRCRPRCGRPSHRPGQSLDDAQGWAKVGITPMIGQNDVPAEQFTLADAAAVNDFARAHGVGQLSMWSLNRDSTCAPPLPAILPVVQNSCSGINQGDQRFADVLDAHAGHRPSVGVGLRRTVDVGHARSGDPVADRDGRRPRAQPLPDLGPLGAVPGWHQGRLAPPGLPGPLLDQRRRPRHAVANADSPGPWSVRCSRVTPLPPCRPSPRAPIPEWEPTQAYAEGARVQVGLVPYEAKWWSKGQPPGESVAGGSPGSW